MNIENKLRFLDYLVDKLKLWYVEAGGNLDNNDLSKLKITKLLFFITASSTTRENRGLLNTFDNFYAMPYGHVESDIQDNSDGSHHFLISKESLAFKEGITSYTNNVQNDEVTNLIDFSIEKLKEENFNLISYSPFELVDLSHRWQSWKSVFSLATKNGRYSMKIPNEMIMGEQKIYK